MDLHKVLKEYWGYESFRPLQQDIMNEVISGNDALAILPTGGGKSLCFQVPAIAMEGICIVVTPLVALMQDQVHQLRKRNIPAEALHTGMAFHDLKNVLEKVIHNQCKFLYVSPERLKTALFREYLPAMPLNLVAVDEAHCISQWGYDFRPSYLDIAELRKEKPDIPVLALTASATAEVQADILEKLLMENATTFRQSFERANLSYSRFMVDSGYSKLVDVVKKVEGTAIVYTRSRKRTKDVYELLARENISAAFYHAGLDTATRKKIQEQWIKNEVRVMVSTNAFGMGIDKPDVRLVVHLDSPDCLENYYQEAGRAGRDQKKAYAVLISKPGEKEELLRHADDRYPAMETIRKVYDSLCNYLQIPVNSGAEINYDMEFSEFIQAFKLETKQVIYSFQALQQSGILSYQEQVFQPSTVCFTTTREQLEQVSESSEKLDDLVKALLRTYGGIIDFPTSISEKQLSKILFIEKNEISALLTYLANAGIIRYSPQKEKPQIRLLTDRVSINDLTIDLKSYQQRKEAYIQRVTEMIRYTETQECRAVFVGRYFGDEKIKKCGICDNCINRKKKEMSRSEFEVIENAILTQLAISNLTVKDILKAIPQFKSEKVMEVISLWEAEKKIRVDSLGRIEGKKKGPG
ncbi:ATP-dependent DNA helicase RecQ [Pollutibacter soli]|uniref:RecQ family ATP-dependent DNA helicase n=1 Tax=Pollutibacter soli TaxID=3034157 RepID=UPI00301397B4